MQHFHPDVLLSFKYLPGESEESFTRRSGLEMDFTRQLHRLSRAVRCESPHFTASPALTSYREICLCVLYCTRISTPRHSRAVYTGIIKYFHFLLKSTFRAKTFLYTSAWASCVIKRAFEIQKHKFCLESLRWNICVCIIMCSFYNRVTMNLSLA